MTNCHQLKLQAADGKMRLTDVADTEQLFRLIQSIPSPKAESFKQWMAQVASQRLDQMQTQKRVLTKPSSTTSDWAILTLGLTSVLRASRYVRNSQTSGSGQVCMKVWNMLC